MSGVESMLKKNISSVYIYEGSLIKPLIPLRI